MAPAAIGPQGFDEAYYLEQYSDVAEAVAAGAFKSGLEHFQKLGSKEIRNPNTFFDTQFYLESNPDILTAFEKGVITSPFEHYQSFGGAEGRKPSSNFVGREDFDFSQYLSSNSDLAAAGITSQKQAYLHYVQFGVAEGRSAKTNSGLSLKNGVPQAKKAPTPTFVGGGGGGGVDPDQTLTGTEKDETLTGGTGNDTVTGGAGADLLTGGGGTDVFVQNNGDSIGYTATGFPLLGFPMGAGALIVFDNGVDIITDFTGGVGGDQLDVAVASSLTTINEGDGNFIPDGSNALVRGSWNSATKTFTQNDAGTDAYVSYENTFAGLGDPRDPNSIILIGAGQTLTADNFI